MVRRGLRTLRGYTYDADGELTNDSTASGSSFNYDANGNRTGQSSGSSGQADNTTTDNELTSDGTYSYAYDAEGNMTSRTDVATGESWQYQYNVGGELIAVLDYPSGSSTPSQTATYAYDAEGQRISESVTSGGTTTVTRYVYDQSGQVALSFNGAGTLTGEYLYGPAIDQLLAQEDGNENVSWTLDDDQGSVTDVVAQTAGSWQLVDHLQYDGFGNIVSQTNATVGATLLQTYSGMQSDSATGLYYDQARYYDSAIGRYISQDPLGFGGGDSNLYRYVGNSPTNGTDPTGTDDGEEGGFGTGWDGGGEPEFPDEGGGEGEFSGESPAEEETLLSDESSGGIDPALVDDPALADEFIASGMAAESYGFDNGDGEVYGIPFQGTAIVDAGSPEFGVSAPAQISGGMFNVPPLPSAIAPQLNLGAAGLGAGGRRVQRERQLGGRVWGRGVVCAGVGSLGDRQTAGDNRAIHVRKRAELWDRSELGIRSTRCGK